jgi:GDP-4-dehydro-6-deoxy-D-mannose reductase
MKKVLIFGSNGFVGPYLTKELSSRGFDVYESDISAATNLKSNNYFSCDITNSVAVFNLISQVKPNYIVNLAAISSVSSSWKKPQLTYQINVGGTINLLDSLVKQNNFSCKVLIIGSSEEYKQSNKPLSEDSPLDSNNPYGLSKESQEKIADLYSSKYRIPVIFTRSFNHTGVGQKETFVIPSFCKQVVDIEKRKAKNELLVGNLDAIRDFSDVRDIVSAYANLLENESNGVFNVGSGIAYSIKEILEKIISKSTLRINYKVDKSKIRPLDTPYICCSKNKLNQKFKYKIDDTLEWIILNDRKN